MKINVYPIVSSLHQGSVVNEETKSLLDDIERKLSIPINITKKEELYQGDLAIILVQSGGSEGYFLENIKNFKEPYYLLTYGTNNSLSASLEILSYIKDRNLEGEVLHGSSDYISQRIKSLLGEKKSLPYRRLGVLGKPSDWLIASDVNYENAKKILNVDLIDISMDEVIDLYNESEPLEMEYNLDFNKDELIKSKRLYKALDRIKEKYNLDGLTIRCFDLLGTIKTTACMALSMFNAKGIIGCCEGDIPSMLSMLLMQELFKAPAFQANPSRIDAVNKTMVFAHCTLPINMVTDYEIMTHYESGIGVAIRGKLKEDKITIFKFSRNLKDYYVTTGRIIRNLAEKNLCRTQIEVEIDDNIEYFLQRPYGNHHIIIYGDHKDEIINFFNNK